MRRRPSEGGFSVVEVSIAMVISSVVVAALAGVLQSQAQAERRVRAFADNQEEVRQAMVALQRDLRSAEPLHVLPTSADYASRVDLSVYDEVDSPAPGTITWRVDTATQQLMREEHDGLGGVVTTYRLRTVTSGGSEPLFRYFKANGDELVPGTDAAADIAACSSRIHLLLVAAPNAGGGTARLESDVQLRNRQSGTGCPQALLP